MKREIVPMPMGSEDKSKVTNIFKYIQDQLVNKYIQDQLDYYT